MSICLNLSDSIYLSFAILELLIYSLIYHSLLLDYQFLEGSNYFFLVSAPLLVPGAALNKISWIELGEGKN
jgi:hypothetical protein